MQWVLTEVGVLAQRASKPEPKQLADGWVRLKVHYCGICRTDAKMWHQGHRDLMLPRVPGHEIVAVDAADRPVVLWPGTACGTCRYCRAERENLCDHMQIMGFHFDGGFGHDLIAPAASLIPIPAAMPPHLACLAEPVGCVLNALEQIRLRPTERLLIVGGGTLGLIAALAAQDLKAKPIVIERRPKKIHKASPFLKCAQLTCLPAPPREPFDAAINACPDPAALQQAITLLVRGGRCAFFSGLAPTPPLGNSEFNLLHYKELTVIGAYGLTRRNMAAALALIGRYPAALSLLVESILPPETLPELLPKVLAGGAFKYILDYTGRHGC